MYIYRPEYASVPFALLNTFPPSELTDETKTLKISDSKRVQERSKNREGLFENRVER